MASVGAIKSWMSWFGWTNGGAPGSVKISADGNPTARHGDPTWGKDVERAIEAVDRERVDERAAELRRVQSED